MADDPGECAADKSAGVARAGDVGIVQHGVAVPRKRPSWLASALPSSATSRSLSAAGNCPRRSPSRPSAARTGSISMASAMTAWSIARGPVQRRHAEHDDLMAEQFDACRTAGAARPQAPVACRCRRRERRAVDLAQRHRDTERAGARDRPIDLSVSVATTVAPRPPPPRCAAWSAAGI